MTMKPLISHLIENHLDRIVSRSLNNCHVKGMSSIMLLESPEQTIRLYYAHDSHELWLNLPDEIEQQQTLAWHPHHCNLTLHVIKGSIINWVVKHTDDRRKGDIRAFGYTYNSNITNGKIGFIKLNEGLISLETLFYETYPLDTYVSMTADTVHTVAIKQGQSAAWLVYEGKEDPNYESINFSYDEHLREKEFADLYQPMTKIEVLQILNELF